MTSTQLVLAELKKRYPDWTIQVDGVRRKKGTKRTFTISTMAMYPRRVRTWGVGGIVENWKITLSRSSRACALSYALMANIPQQEDASQRLT